MAGGSKTKTSGGYSTPAASPAAASRGNASGADSTSSSYTSSNNGKSTHPTAASPSPSPTPSTASKKWQKARASSTPKPAWNSTPVNNPVTPRTPTAAGGDGGGSPSPAAASELFRLGATMVLDEEKQDKLANLIKAVQCVSLTHPPLDHLLMQLSFTLSDRFPFLQCLVN
jgi:hypothetical protein